MPEYHKIETLFERDMEGNKKLIEGKFRSPSVEFLKDNKWQFTRRLMVRTFGYIGTDIRCSLEGERTRLKIPTNLMYALNDKFMGNTNEELFEQKFGEMPVTLFGEGYGSKIQKGGGNYRSDVGFILFDVFINGTWLERENIEDIARAFNVPVVPIVLEGTIDDAVKLVKAKPKSTIAQIEHESEGLVGKPSIEMKDRFGNRLIVKIKVCDFDLLTTDKQQEN